MPSYRPVGEAALRRSESVLKETRERLETLLIRGDLSCDAEDEHTTIKRLMRVKAALKSVKSTLRKMDGAKP